MNGILITLNQLSVTNLDGISSLNNPKQKEINTVL